MAIIVLIWIWLEWILQGKILKMSKMSLTVQWVDKKKYWRKKWINNFIITKKYYPKSFVSRKINNLVIINIQNINWEKKWKKKFYVKMKLSNLLIWHCVKLFSDKVISTKNKETLLHSKNKWQWHWMVILLTLIISTGFIVIKQILNYYPSSFMI